MFGASLLGGSRVDSMFGDAPGGMLGLFDPIQRSDTREGRGLLFQRGRSEGLSEDMAEELMRDKGEPPKGSGDLATALRAAEDAEFEASRRCRRAERERDEARAALEKATAALADRRHDTSWQARCGELQAENDRLKAELETLKRKQGSLPGNLQGHAFNGFGSFSSSGLGLPPSLSRPFAAPGSDTSSVWICKVRTRFTRFTRVIHPF